MTYTDEELVRELEHRFQNIIPPTALLWKALDRLLELSTEAEEMQRQLESAQGYEEELCGRIGDLEEEIRSLQDDEPINR